MEQLKRQVGKAQRWLGLQRFVGVLGWCCLATLTLAVLAVLVGKFRPTGAAAWVWSAEAQEAGLLAPLVSATMCILVALAVGILAATAWAASTGRGPIDAALEIDRRFRLKERVSSAVAMSDEERRSAPGQAVVDDAVRRVRRIDVGEHFTLSPGRQILLPLIPAVLAFLVAWLVSPAAVDQQAQANTDPQIKKQIEQSTESLRKKLVEQRKRAQEQGLKDAQDLFKRLEEGTDDLAEKAQGERKKALVKLNDLAREIQQRREQLGGAEKIQQQLRQLKNIDQGPADKLLKAVQQGNFKQAREELEKLKEQLAGDDLNDEQRKELANQLNQMEEKLKKLAEAHRQAEQDLQNRADQARQAGRPDEANKLEEQLNKLRQQLPQMNMLQDLASKLGQCAECLNDGQLQDAASTLDGLQADLSSLEQQLQEMQMLDEALGQLAQSRDQMSCSQCGGVGCGACQGQIPGVGLGEGQGIGDRPEEENDVKFYNTQASVKTGPGAASIVGEVEGPNIKGDVQQEMKEQYEAAQRRSTDPLVGQQMSREHRRHAQEYFDRFREGE